MTEDFDPDQVLSIVQEALAEDPDFFRPRQGIPLAFNEGLLLEKLSEKLKGYLHEADIQLCLSDLRSSLLEGMSQPSLKHLHEIALNCRKCPNLKPPAKLPIWNLSDPDILLVLEHPFFKQDVFDVLIDSLSKVGFSSTRSALSYAARCSASKNEYDAGNFANCISYLLTEINILKPKLIFALGSGPASVITNTTVQATKARGRISWLGPWAFSVTHSPGYVAMAGGRASEEFVSDISMAYNFLYG